LTVSERTARLDQLLREEISGIIAKEISDPRVGFVTVTEVDVTQDLSHATVWVSVIGDEAQRELSLRTLGRAMPFVRHRLGQLRIRKVPELHLRHDDSVERGTRVLRLIDEVGAGEASLDAVPPPARESLPTPHTARGSIEPPVPPRPRSARDGSGRRAGADRSSSASSRHKSDGRGR
jgi:ribosome-binding factor A